MKKRLLAGIMAGVMAASVLVTGCGGSKDVKDGTFTPTKTIQWMCTSSAGGGSDIFTRKISDIMTAQNLVNGQTIVVTNKTDGSGEVGRNEVAGLKKNADYQLLTFNSGDLMPMVTNTKNRLQTTNRRPWPQIRLANTSSRPPSTNRSPWRRLRG